MDWRDIAKAAADVATGLVADLNPIAGVVFKWATAVAFEVIDDAQAGDKVAAAQHAGDRVADLVEDLKLAGRG